MTDSKSTVDGRKLIETACNLIKNNPEEAASLLRTWLMSKEYKDREKAAVFIISMKEYNLAEVFHHFLEPEIETLTFEIARLESICWQYKFDVLLSFVNDMSEQRFTAFGGVDCARVILEKTIGEERVLSCIAKSTNSLTPFSFLRQANPSTILNLIRQEAPQPIAVILSFMESSKASLVLQNLSHEVQGDILRRIAYIDRIELDIIREIEQVLEEKLSDIESKRITVDGMERAVEILKLVDRVSEEQIIEILEAEDPELAEWIKKQLFKFEDIVMLSDRDTQKVMRELDSQDLCKALKSVSSEVQNKIFRNMSKRAATMLKEDMEYMGAISLNEIEEAQKRILSIVRHLENVGEIIMHSREVVGIDTPFVSQTPDIQAPDIVELESDFESFITTKDFDPKLIFEHIDYHVIVRALKLTNRIVFDKVAQGINWYKRRILWRNVQRHDDNISLGDVDDARKHIITILQQYQTTEELEADNG